MLTDQGNRALLDACDAWVTRNAEEENTVTVGQGGRFSAAQPSPDREKEGWSVHPCGVLFTTDAGLVAAMHALLFHGGDDIAEMSESALAIAVARAKTGARGLSVTERAQWAAMLGEVTGGEN